jgi:hypothetical protein
LEFALSYERALADMSQSLAKLEMLVGQEIRQAGNQKSDSNVNTTRQEDNNDMLK